MTRPAAYADAMLIAIRDGKTIEIPDRPAKRIQGNREDQSADLDQHPGYHPAHAGRLPP